MPLMNIYLTEKEEQKLQAYKRKHMIMNNRDAIGRMLLEMKL